MTLDISFLNLKPTSSVEARVEPAAGVLGVMPQQAEQPAANLPAARPVEVMPIAEPSLGLPEFCVCIKEANVIKGGTNSEPILTFNIIFNVCIDGGPVIPVCRTMEIDSSCLTQDALKQLENNVVRLESVENKTGESQAKVAKRMRELAGIPHRGNFV